MNISHLDSAEKRAASAHRPGGIGFISHLKGVEYQPDNFDLLTVFATSDYHAPRHRHNFDQIRIMLKGSFQWNHKSIQEAGMVGYFTEGTLYTQQGLDDSEMLLLQIGGPEGEGYMSYAQMQQGIRELQERGEFKEGIYEGKDTSGNKIKRDGYEAIWVHVFGRNIKYCKPRFEAPVMLRPERFKGIKTECKGVQIKPLCVFNERGLGLAQLRIESGYNHKIIAVERPRLLYFLSGKGQLNDTHYSRGTAVYLDMDESADMHADDTTEIYIFGLPTFN